MKGNWGPWHLSKAPTDIRGNSAWTEKTKTPWGTIKITEFHGRLRFIKECDQLILLRACEADNFRNPGRLNIFVSSPVDVPGNILIAKRGNFYRKLSVTLGCVASWVPLDFFTGRCSNFFESQTYLVKKVYLSEQTHSCL